MRRRLKILRHIFRFRGFRQSLKLAVVGIGYLFVYHRNMRIIFLSGLLAVAAGFYFRLKGIELVALCITVTLVFMAEIFNTAIELMIDMATSKYHPLIKLVKDIAAAVVLLASLNAVAVGGILFGPRLLARLSVSYAQDFSASQLQKAQEDTSTQHLLLERLGLGKGSYFVRKIVVQGAVSLDPEKLREVTRPFEGRRINKEDLDKLTGLIQEEYLKIGKHCRLIDCTIQAQRLEIKLEEENGGKE